MAPKARANDTLTAQERDDLQKQLDEIQKNFTPKTGAQNATNHYGDMVKNTIEPRNAMPSKAERMFKLLEEGKQLGAGKNQSRVNQREDTMLRKDGLDISLQHLREDASRMRATMTEVDIALGKPKRDKLAAQVSMAAVPRAVVDQFEDQQKVLLEQRRQLEELRREKQHLEFEQRRELQYARNDYNNTIGDADLGQKDSTKMDPMTLREAHAMLRDETNRAIISGTRDIVTGPTDNAPARDGYLLVEVFNVEGLSGANAPGIKSFTVRALDNSEGSSGREILTEATVAGPLGFDGMRPKAVQLTIPADSIAANINIELTVNGEGGGATKVVPFGHIDEDRTDPTSTRLDATGDWKTNGLNVYLTVAMSGTAPFGPSDRIPYGPEGSVRTNTRIVKNPANANFSRFPGNDLQASEGHMRAQAIAWQNAGCPEPANTTELLREADPSRARASPRLSSPNWERPDGVPAHPQKPHPRSILTGTTHNDWNDEKYKGAFAGFQSPVYPDGQQAINEVLGRGPDYLYETPLDRTPIGQASPPAEQALQATEQASPPAKAGAAGKKSALKRNNASARGFQTRSAPSREGPDASSKQAPHRNDDQNDAGLNYLSVPQRGHPESHTQRSRSAGPGYAGKDEPTQQGIINKATTSRSPRQRPSGGQSREAREQRHLADTATPSSASSKRAPIAAFAGYGDRSVTPRRDQKKELVASKPRGSARGKSTPAKTKSDKSTVGGIPFAAFAGEGAPAQKVAPNQPGASGGKIMLRPPAADGNSVEGRYSLIKQATQDGKLGPEDAQIVFEFAALVATEGALEAGRPTDDILAEYAGIILDGLEEYKSSVTLCLTMMEALVVILDNVSPNYKNQLSVPLYAGIQECAFRYQKIQDLDVHKRLLAAMIAVMTPDCVIADGHVVDYVLSITRFYQTRLPPITAEHALGVLCVASSMHRVAEQILTASLMLRGYKSDPHLAIRALVTMSEIWEFLESDRVKYGQAADKDAFLKLREIPTDAGDVRLIANTMDLYPGHRKVAGAALRTFAVLARASDVRLHMVLTDAQRVMMQAQRRHVDSRSVNLHVAEIMCTAAKEHPEWISEGSVFLISHSLRAFWRDPAVALQSLETLAALAEEGMKYDRIMDIFPVSQVLLLGDVHFAEAPIATALSRLVFCLAKDGPDVLHDLGKSGAVSVCVRALEANPRDTENVRAAAKAIKVLTVDSDDARRHVARLAGSKSLFDALIAQHSDAGCVQAILAALAVIGQDEISRLQLVDPDILDESALVLISLRRAAFETCGQDPDILAWLSLAVGTLTYAESDADKGKQKKMRQVLDDEHLEEGVQEARVQSGMRLGSDFFQRLMNTAQMVDLEPEQILDDNGREVAHLHPRKGMGAAFDSEHVKIKPIKMSTDPYSSKINNGGYDIFKPLRKLGFGKKEIPYDSKIDEVVDEDQDAKDAEDAITQGKFQAGGTHDKQGGGGGGGLGGIFGLF